MSKDAAWRVGVNGVLKDVPGAAGQPVGVMGTITIQIEPSALKPGENEMVVEPQAGAMRIALDDCYDFDRSAVRDAEGAWRTDRLDTQTYRRRPSLHIADGELRIRLEILVKHEIPATSPTSADSP